MHFKAAATAAGIAALLVPPSKNIASAQSLIEYNWTLRSVRASPADPTPSIDCNLHRLMLLINDEYPGPPLRANVGDTLRITLTNEDPANSFTLHHHGLHMKGLPYYDGTASASQCASGVLQTQVYEFEVNEVGTHYWHGHMAMERGDGYQGAIIVTDPNDAAEQQLESMYDDEEIIFLQDWYHLTGSELQAGLDSNPFIWVGNAQSFAINGGALYLPCLENTTSDPTNDCANNCSIENYIKTVEVEAGKTYRLRIIGGQILIGVNFAIANHTMTVVEVEGTLCEPFEVDNLDVMPGQRYSVLVTMDQDPNSYWGTSSVRYRSSGPFGGIIFKYTDAPDANLTLDGPFPDHPLWDDMEPTLDLEAKLATKDIESYPDSDVLSADEDLIRRIIMVGTQATDLKSGRLRWAVNNVTYNMPSTPFIKSAYEAVNKEGAEAWPNTAVPGAVVLPETPPTPWNYSEPVHDSVGSYNGESGASMIPVTEGEIIEIVMQNAMALNNVTEMHPWHLHGYAFFVIGMGDGVYDEASSPDTYNLVNPIRRDTFTLLPNGWTAIRFRANNVGVWPFHCAIPPHLVMGMETLLVVSPDKLDAPPSGSSSCGETSLASDVESTGNVFEDDTSAESQENSEVESTSDIDNVATDSVDNANPAHTSFSFLSDYVLVVCAAVVLSML